jgi:hypothetical protein
MEELRWEGLELCLWDRVAGSDRMAGPSLPETREVMHEFLDRVLGKATVGPDFAAENRERRGLTAGINKSRAHSLG